MCVSGKGTFGRKMEKGLKELSSPGVGGGLVLRTPGRPQSGRGPGLAWLKPLVWRRRE